jgi:PAS domain S-box-containing protein
MISKIKQLEKKIKELENKLVEQKNVKGELKDSEERFKTIFEFAPDACFLSDLKGVFIDGNKAAEEMVGYKKKELAGKSMLKLKLLPIDQILNAIRRLAEHALGKATEPGEFDLIKKDGSRIKTEISGTLIKIKGRKIILGIVRNITERKKIEEELKSKNEKFEAFNKLAVGRELKMIELKNKIEKLEKKTKEDKN